MGPLLGFGVGFISRLCLAYGPYVTFVCNHVCTILAFHMNKEFVVGERKHVIIVEFLVGRF